LTQQINKTENKSPKTNNTENKIPKPNIALKNFKFNTRKKRICFFTQQEIIPDYKDTNIIGKFISPNKQLISARKTGTSAKNQRLLSTAIKRARFIGLLPYTINHKGVDGNWMVS
jgi:small subunit ribosomal protein S18|tara:strand:- start:6238 stop:6582 length:345 start_codon:yes stop_codon:yes gene_type:complete